MTTIINTPPSGEGSGSGAGLVLGVVIALILVALFFVYGLPALRSIGPSPAKQGSIDVNVKLPETNNNNDSNSQQQ